LEVHWSLLTGHAGFRSSRKEGAGVFLGEGAVRTGAETGAGDEYYFCAGEETFTVALFQPMADPPSLMMH
jgi:hypothetical protein